MDRKWDWQHVAIIVAAIAGAAAIVVAGRGDALVAVLAALGGGTTLVALAKAPPGSAPRDRGLGAVEPLVVVLTVAFLAAQTAVGCAWLRSSAPEAVQAGELVLHALDSGCGVVALLHDETASAVCLGVSELDQLDRRLEETEAAKVDAPIAIVSSAGMRRVRVRHRHARNARASVQVARAEVSP